MSGIAQAGDATSRPSSTDLAAFGLDPTWSRLVTFDGIEGPLTWHILDTGVAADQSATIVCVHGNPTWSYIWHQVLRMGSPSFRVVAIDQTNMGFSDRQGPRRLADRIVELVRFCAAEIDGPIVLAAHDWGGPIAVGAVPALDPIAIILTNTAVAKPDGVRVPPLIAAARGLVDLSCQRTPAFVEGTARMTSRDHRRAIRSPYQSAARRGGVRDFVADIPLDDSHPSAAALHEVAAVAASIAVPTLLIFGGADPVFHDRFRRDLEQRIPHADVERFDGVGHLVTIDAPVGDLISRWLDDRLGSRASLDVAPEASGSLLDQLEVLRGENSLVYSGPDGALGWSTLDDRARRGAAALVRNGLTSGSRVSILIPPGPDLLVAACAVWMAGGIPVVADASGGIAQLRRLIRASTPSWVLGTTSTLGLARTMRVAPGATAAGFVSLPGVIDLRDGDSADYVALTPHRGDIAAIVHTSGATGAPKAVAYTHGALGAQRDVLEQAFGLTQGRHFTTSFASFMLLAPVLGMTCWRPDVPVDAPSSLSYDHLAAVCAATRIDAAWLSPAAARRVVATADGRQLRLPLTMLAGAPIAPALASSMRAVTAGEVRTPYGMTECLPITDGSDHGADAPLGGTCVGRPVQGALIDTIALDGPDGSLVEPQGWGEIIVSAPWMYSHYDHSYLATSGSQLIRHGLRYHRTGDVGYLAEGRLFILGRLGHVIWTSDGPHPSVGLEEPIARAIGEDVAAVGVGPRGASVIVIVVADTSKLRLCDQDLADKVRRASAVPVASVLAGSLPVDHRHESKVDRQALAHAASDFLQGR